MKTQNQTRGHNEKNSKKESSEKCSQNWIKETSQKRELSREIQHLFKESNYNYIFRNFTWIDSEKWRGRAKAEYSRIKFDWEAQVPENLPLDHRYIHLAKINQLWRVPVRSMQAIHSSKYTRFHIRIKQDHYKIGCLNHLFSPFTPTEVVLSTHSTTVTGRLFTMCSYVKPKKVTIQEVFLS